MPQAVPKGLCCASTARCLERSQLEDQVQSGLCMPGKEAHLRAISTSLRVELCRS